MRRSLRSALLLTLVLPASACFDGVFGEYALTTSEGAGGAPASGGAAGTGGVERGHDEGGAGMASGGQPGGGEAGSTSLGGTSGTSGHGAGGEPAGEGGGGGSGVSGSSGQGGAATGGGGEGGSGDAGGSGAGGGSGASGSGGVSPTFCAGASAWACDPTTLMFCGTTAGSACDIDVSMGKFTCFAPPNVLPLGSPCKLSGPDFCTQGATCLNGACVRFCCDDGTCQNHDTCQPGNLPGVTVGLCACDPVVRATLAPTLGTLAEQYAFGDVTEGAALCGALAEGGAQKREVLLMPNRCYTAIGVNDGSGMQLLLRIDTAAATPMLLASSSQSAAPVLGPQPGCFKISGTAPVAAVLQVVAKKGSGNVLAQLYSK